MEAIKYFVKGAFVGIVETPDVREQQEELIADLSAKVDDLVADGRSEQEALGMAIASMGDLSALVREFATEPAAAPVEVAPVTVEAYTSRLRLHTVALAAGGAVAVLFLLSVLALNLHALDALAALWDVFLTFVGIGWTGVALWRFHQRPDMVDSVAVGANARLGKAWLQWAGVCVLALLFNMLLGRNDFFAWTICIGAAAWPASFVIEQRLIEAGKFLHPKVVADPAADDASVPAGATAGTCA